MSRWRLALVVLGTVALVGGIAVAQSGSDPKDAKITEAIGVLEDALAIPPTTVTETATITETATETITETPTTTIPTTTCTGVAVPPGTGLKAATDAFSTPRTFCLSAGTYTVSNTVFIEGDTVIGAGRDATFIDGSTIPTSNGRIFVVRGSQGVSTFRGFDIFGARTPAVGQQATCFQYSGTQSPSACGKAFTNFGNGMRVFDVDCHHNGANCVGGSADLTMDNVDCWENGNAYSMQASYRFAACVKQATANVEGINDVTITNSHIHDNPWAGLWCDFCKFGAWLVEGNVIEDNGVRGIQWEMSGGWSTSDSAVVRDNVIQNNGLPGTDTSGVLQGARGGIDVSTANDILIEGNTFGGNSTNAVWVVFTSSRNPPQPDSRGVVIRNNTLNGDTLGSSCSFAGVVCSGNP